ncbi:hypothetical protein AB0C15_16805 [Micromonospora sp. NPDC048835]|uniref:hypothetical protein n=1 Tax=Micromonospora sp. NPDC048835 TaxID=3155147 RepID=UPI0033CB5B7D
MTVRRLGAGLVAAALITPALAACASGTGTGTAGSTPSPTVTASGAASPSGAPVAGDAKQALLDSTKEISNGNFRFTLAGAGSTAEGLVHQPSQSAAMKISIGGPSSDLAMKLDVIHFKPDSWVKLELSGPTANSLPAIKQLNLGKYQHLDQTRIKGNRSLGFDFEKVDPAGSAVLTQGITEVRSTGTGAYAGTIDVTKAAEAGSLNAATIAALGTQAKTVPFTAKVDPQGRLSELVLQLPAAGQTAAQEVKMTYSDYGAATAAQKPPADQVVEAPAELYSLFN